MKNRTKNNLQGVFVAILIYALLFVVFLFNFYDTDDFAMQTTGRNALMNGLDFSIHYGNGRFIGNLALYYFNFYPVIRMVLKPLVLTVLIACLFFVFNIEKLWMKITTALLVVIPSSGFFAKCYSSNPCIMNYVAPLANVMFCLSIMKFIGMKKRKLNFLLYPVLLIASVCMQFYSENATVVFLTMSVFFIVRDFCMEKTAHIRNIVFFIGGTVGAALMFIVPSRITYSVIDADVMANYRHIIINIPYAIGVVAKFGEYFSTACIWIALFAAVLIYIVCKESLNDKFKFWHILFASVYPVVCVIYKFIQTEEAKVISSVKLFLTGLMFLFMLNALIIIFRFITSAEVKVNSVFMIFIFAMSVGMFMVLNQHGYRTFYLSLIIFIALTLYLADYVAKRYDIAVAQNRTKIFNSVAVAVFLCVAILMPLQTIQNYDVFAMRQEYVTEKIAEGDELIYVPKVPNKSLVRDEFLDFYKEYFSKDNPDVEIRFIDIEDWEKFEEYQSMMDNPITSITYAVGHLGYSN